MTRARLSNIGQLAIKEFRSLWHDKVLLVLILWVFTGGIYSAATATSQELHNAPVAIVDEDRSPLSLQIAEAFYGPYFKPAEHIPFRDVDPALFEGRYTFVLVIPSGFQRDMLAGKHPDIQINIDATRMSQAFIGDTYIQSIITGEIGAFLDSRGAVTNLPIELVTRNKYNPNLEGHWFGSIMEIISNVTLLAIILTGAAVIREREHGTLEHLLAMPVTPMEIVSSKILASGLTVLVAATLSLIFMVQGVLGVPVHGSVPLFVAGAALHLFAATSIGIFLGTIARSMPQLGLLMILTILPLQLLSGAITPRESMPDAIQTLMLAAPTTHFVSLAQGILYRGADLAIVWPAFLALAFIGLVFFLAAVGHFRRSVAG